MRAGVRRTSATSAEAAARRASSTRSRSSPATSRSRSIFFNIFGGITRCDEVARGILAALDRLDMSRYPIVVRLDGTNAEEGRQILADAGRENIHPEATMLDGARRAVELAA